MGESPWFSGGIPLDSVGNQMENGIHLASSMTLRCLDATEGLEMEIHQWHRIQAQRLCSVCPFFWLFQRQKISRTHWNWRSGPWLNKAEKFHQTFPNKKQSHGAPRVSLWAEPRGLEVPKIGKVADVNSGFKKNSPSIGEFTKIMRKCNKIGTPHESWVNITL